MLSPDFWWALYSFLRTGYYLSACTKRRGTICPHVQIDGVLFVRLCKSTGYYLSACAKMTGYYLSGVLFVRDSTFVCKTKLCHCVFFFINQLNLVYTIHVYMATKSISPILHTGTVTF